MSGVKGGQTLSIEACDQSGNGMAGAAAWSAGSELIGFAGRDGEEDFGTGDLSNWGAMGAGQLL
jgi:hypothetical protein